MRFRETRLFGTGGEIWGDGRYIRIFDFLKGERTVDLEVEAEGSIRSGHGGGDMGLMAAFVLGVEREDPSGLEPFEEALYAHRLTFLAEEARRAGGWWRWRKAPGPETGGGLAERAGFEPARRV